MHMQLGQNPAVIVSSPRLAKEVLKTNDIALGGRPMTLVGEIVLYGNSDIVFGSYGDYWRQMKKMITIELLSAKKVRSFSSIRKQELDHLLEFIRLADGKPIIIREKVTEIINNIICKASFGNNCKQQDVFIEALDDLGRLVSGFYVADLFPEFRFLSVISGMRSRLTKIHKLLDKMMDDIFEERKITQRKGGSSDNTLLDALMEIKENGGLEFPITDNNIKAIFVNLFTGGTDTSVLTIEWAMAEMMRKPSVMKKAQTEVREAFKGKKTIIETDLQALIYLKFVIKETLRLHPPVPLLVPHQCREQCQIDGYDIPVKTQVLVNVLACTTDPEYWHDAESFLPERFEKTSADFLGNNYEFIVFGSGRRICPGINFGLASVEFALAQLLYYFNWELPKGVDPKDLDMEVKHAAILAKKVPLELIPTPYSPI